MQVVQARKAAVQSSKPAIHFNKGEFIIRNLPALRTKPEVDFQHRLKTKAHLEYLQQEKMFDVSDPRWAKATVNGEVLYAHEYEGCIFEVRLRTADHRFTLSNNELGAFDRHLRDNPGENTVYSITSKNNGLESTQTFSATTAGLSSVGIVCAALALTVWLANGIAATEAAEYVVGTVAAVIGVELDVLTAGVGLVLAVLAFIGIWIAYAVGREIMLNVIYENRSLQTIKLVDHYVYNIGDNLSKFPIPLPPLESDPPFEFYSDVVINVDNYSKIRGVGLSMIFQKENGDRLAICIRQDIYHNPAYQIFFPQQGYTALEVYANCGTGDLLTTDYWWGKDMYVKNCLDPAGFMQYNFSGIISFHSP